MIRFNRPEVREGMEWVLAEEVGADYALVKELGAPLARNWVPLPVELVWKAELTGPWFELAWAG